MTTTTQTAIQVFAKFGDSEAIDVTDLPEGVRAATMAAHLREIGISEAMAEEILVGHPEADRDVPGLIEWLTDAHVSAGYEVIVLECDCLEAVPVDDGDGTGLSPQMVDRMFEAGMASEYNVIRLAA